LNYFLATSQNQLRGITADKNGQRYGFINLILKDPKDSTTISFSHSDENGKFLFTNVANGRYLLQASGIGFKIKRLVIDLPSPKVDSLVILLEENEILLNEVIVHGEEPIRIKGDTIILEAEAFSNGNEVVVEDLLKKLPGLKVDENGVIKVGDREIEKIMVEGDDLFDKGYKILSKNMPSFSIKSVELLQNYTDNSLLKGVEKTEKVALNLKLKPSFKSVLFGNINSANGFGGKYRFDSRFNVLNFGKSTKYYLTGNVNNTGYDASGDIDGLIHPNFTDDNFTIGDSEKAQELISVSVHPTNFKKERTNFNQATLLSPSILINPSCKWKIRTNWLWFNDRNHFFRSRTDQVSVGALNFINQESDSTLTIQDSFLGTVEGSYSHSKDLNLGILTKFGTGSINESSNLVFNSTPLAQSLRTQNEIVDQKLLLTKRLSKESAFQLTGRFILGNNRQGYRTSSMFLRRVLNNVDSMDVVNQSVFNKIIFGGTEARYINTNEISKSSADLRIGNRLRQDNFNTNLTASNLGETEGVQLQTNDFYISTKFSRPIKRLSLIGKFEAHLVSNKVSIGDSVSLQIPFFIVPSLGIDWHCSSRSKLSSTFSYSRTNMDIIDIYKNYTISSFRSVNKGLGQFNQLESSRLFLNYQSGSWGEKLFMNFFVLYTHQHNFLSTNSWITKEVLSIEKVLVKNRGDFNSSFSLDYFLKNLNCNVKLEAGLATTSFVNFINASASRSIQSSNFRYGIEFRSAFDFAVNFHVGTKWLPFFIDVNLQKNSFVDFLSFADLTIDIGKRLNFQLQTERYHFGNVGINNVFYFLDFNLQYNIKANKCIFSITGRNMLDNTFFRSFSLTDTGSTSYQYPLLSRFVLARVEYRF
jgi:hypothetical protein